MSDNNNNNNNNKNNSSKIVDGLSNPKFWDTPTGKSTVAIMSLLVSPANQLAVLLAQSCSPGSVEDDMDDKDEVAGPATISSWELMLFDKVQQTELVNKGVKTVEDKLFTMLGSNAAYTHMDLLNDSANNPLLSYLPTLPESHYYNNLEIGGQKLASLEQTIKNESFFIERKLCSFDEDNQSLVEATPTCNTKKSKYCMRLPKRFVENVKA